MAQTKPTLQHLDNSQSQSILWLLEELGIEYNLNLFERGKSGPKKDRAPDSLKETHPLGKSPQLITESGRVIIERPAIAKYLIEKYDTTGKFKINPNDTENDQIREEQLVSFGGSSLNPILILKMTFKYMHEGSPFFVRPLIGAINSTINKMFINKEIEIMMRYLDEGLKGKEYLMNTNDPTRADFCNLWYMDMAAMSGMENLDAYPNVKDWYIRCKNRPAWKRSLEKGNTYKYQFKM